MRPTTSFDSLQSTMKFVSDSISQRPVHDMFEQQVKQYYSEEAGVIRAVADAMAANISGHSRKQDYVVSTVPVSHATMAN